MKLRKVGILSLGLSVVLFSILISVVSTINTGCSPTPTAAPTYVTFQITNTNASTISEVLLARNSTSLQYTQNCSIAAGTTVSVNVSIPANDTYDVSIISQRVVGYAVQNYSDSWSAVSLSLGTTYNATINSGTGTLNSVSCSCSI